MGAAVLAVLVLVLVDAVGGLGLGTATLVAATCGAVSLAFIAYLVWTHLAFARTSPASAARIGATQLRRGAHPMARMLGLASTESWATSAAAVALLGAIAAAIYGAGEGGVLLTVVALITAASAWATVAVAFGLRYFRLHAAGEAFAFDLEGEPEYGDFMSFALMVSAAGALSGAAPRTRDGLRAVRTHTVIAFVFNAIVVAMTVSLLAGLIAALGTA